MEGTGMHGESLSSFLAQKEEELRQRNDALNAQHGGAARVSHTAASTGATHAAADACSGTTTLAGRSAVRTVPGHSHPAQEVHFRLRV